MSQYQLIYNKYAPHIWQALGEIERTGWVMREVRNPESVQEHTLALIRLAYEIPGLEKNRQDKLCAILEVHDWPEAIVGDEVILEYDEVEKRRRKQKKHQREEEAMKQICAPLGAAGDEIFAL